MLYKEGICVEDVSIYIYVNKVLIITTFRLYAVMGVEKLYRHQDVDT